MQVLPRARETPLLMIDDQFLEKIISSNGEVLCSQLEEFICDYPAAFSTTGMIEFIKLKQSENIPELAKLKKVALPYMSLESEQKCVLSDELRSYISQGLALHLRDSNNSVVYRDSAAYYVDAW
jgi:hypothetical protein